MNKIDKAELAQRRKEYAPFRAWLRIVPWILVFIIFQILAYWFLFLRLHIDANRDAYEMAIPILASLVFYLFLAKRIKFNAKTWGAYFISFAVCFISIPNLLQSLRKKTGKITELNLHEVREAAAHYDYFIIKDAQPDINRIYSHRFENYDSDDSEYDLKVRMVLPLRSSDLDSSGVWLCNSGSDNTSSKSKVSERLDLLQESVKEELLYHQQVVSYYERVGNSAYRRNMKEVVPEFNPVLLRPRIGQFKERGNSGLVASQLLLPIGLLMLLGALSMYPPFTIDASVIRMVYIRKKKRRTVTVARPQRGAVVILLLFMISVFAGLAANTGFDLWSKIVAYLMPVIAVLLTISAVSQRDKLIIEEDELTIEKGRLVRDEKFSLARKYLSHYFEEAKMDPIHQVKVFNFVIDTPERPIKVFKGLTEDDKEQLEDWLKPNE